MNKLLLVIAILMFNANLFSFSLSSLEFDEVLKKGEYKIKEYTLKNTTNEIKRYSISVDSKNVEIKPKVFVLSPQKEQIFIIKVLGEENKKVNEYNLTIFEKYVNKDGNKQNSVYVNKIVQIKQKYYIKEK